MIVRPGSALIATVFFMFLMLFPFEADAFCFEEAGETHGVSRELLQSIARVESNLNAKAVNVNKNGTRDLGLMQINSTWIGILNLNKAELISNPCYNVMTGAGILRQCIDRFGYTWEAVGCYNAKSKDKRVGYSWKIFRELRKEMSRKSAEEKQQQTDTMKPRQSLQFRVRDVEKPMVNGAQ